MKFDGQYADNRRAVAYLGRQCQGVALRKHPAGSIGGSTCDWPLTARRVMSADDAEPGAHGGRHRAHPQRQPAEGHLREAAAAHHGLHQHLQPQGAWRRCSCLTGCAQEHVSLLHSKPYIMLLCLRLQVRDLHLVLLIACVIDASMLVQAVLETTLRGYSCLTVGDAICVHYNNKKYFIDVIEARPANAIGVIDTDCQVTLGPCGLRPASMARFPHVYRLNPKLQILRCSASARHTQQLSMAATCRAFPVHSHDCCCVKLLRN